MSSHHAKKLPVAVRDGLIWGPEELAEGQQMRRLADKRRALRDDSDDSDLSAEERRTFGPLRPVRTNKKNINGHFS